MNSPKEEGERQREDIAEGALLGHSVVVVAVVSFFQLEQLCSSWRLICSPSAYANYVCQTRTEPNRTEKKRKEKNSER